MNRPLPLLLIAALVVTGCDNGAPAPQKASRSSSKAAEQRRANQSELLLRSAIGRLRVLPDVIDPQLHPPSVVLDARSSTNGGELLAIVEFTKGDEANGLNLLTVRTENAGFGSRQIQAGDIVKCYLLPDRESRVRLKETGDLSGAVLTHEAVERTVAQVLSQNSLRLTEGLRIPVRVAQELTTDLDRATIARLEAQGIVNARGILLSPRVLQQLPGIAWPFRVEVWRVRDDRMRSVETNLNKYAARGEPSFGWEPTGDQEELEQLAQRINQWLRGREKPTDWAPAELLATLDAKLRDAPRLADYFSPKALGRKTFERYEARLIQEAIWLRDISRWAAGNRFDPVERGTKLFDWVVRNVALSDDPRVTANRPWQALISGRGAAAQRAWVLAGLCRQQQIPFAVVEIPRAESAPWLWCGVRGERGLHLFDPQLGLPIPAQQGNSEQAATLADVKQNAGLLRRLDLPDAPYPVTAEMLAGAKLNVVAEPLALSWRGGEFATQLRGEDALVLSVDADADAAKLAELGAGEIGLWSAPFDYFRRRRGFGPNTRNAQRIEFLHYAWRPVLWQARVLHFRGLFETEEQAKKKAKLQGDALYDAVNDHRTAARRYSDKSVRPGDNRLAVLSADKRRIYRRAKVDATYWLGLLNFDKQRYKVSRRWLENSIFSNPAADYRADGVRYNHARTLEALGEHELAAELLEADDSPQQHGNRLRAMRLRDAAQDSSAAQDPGDDDS